MIDKAELAGYARMLGTIISSFLIAKGWSKTEYTEPLIGFIGIILMAVFATRAKRARKAEAAVEVAQVKTVAAAEIAQIRSDTQTFKKNE